MTSFSEGEIVKLQINDFYYISDIAEGDKAAYLEHFKEKQIYDQTLAIPYPYTKEDADWWVNHNIEVIFGLAMGESEFKTHEYKPKPSLALGSHL